MTINTATAYLKVGDRVVWRRRNSYDRGAVHRCGRITSMSSLNGRFMYHVLDDEGIHRVVPRELISKEAQSEPVVTFNPLDVKQCRHCGAYLQSGLQNTVHPDHSASCELHPDNAWRGYMLVKQDDCDLSQAEPSIAWALSPYIDADELGAAVTDVIRSLAKDRLLVFKGKGVEL